jgi:hypothetical protein
VALNSTGFGSFCAGARGLCNDTVSLVGTGLENIATKTVKLSNFQGGWNNYFNATEIQVNGTAASVAAPIPEPETYAMMLAGLGVMGFIGKRRRKAI